MRPHAARGVLGAVAALTVVLFAVHTAPVRNYALTRLTTYLRTAHALELQAAALRYNLLSLSATLEEVRIATVTAPGEPFAQARRLELGFGPGVLSGAPDLRRIEIDAPALRLSDNNLPAMADSGDGPLMTLPEVQTRDLDISLAFGSTAISVDDAAIDVRPSAAGVLLGTIGAPGGGPATFGDTTIDADAANLAFTFDGRQLTIHEFVTAWPGTAVEGSGLVEFPGDAATLDLTFTATTEMATWERVAGAPITGKVRAAGGVEGTFDDPNVSIVFNSPRLDAADLMLEDVDLNLAFSQGALSLERLEATLGGGTISGQGRVALDTSAPSHVDLRWTGVDLTRVKPAMPLMGRVAGDGNARIEWRDDAASTRMLLRGTTGVVTGGRRITVDISGAGHGPRWQVHIAPRDTTGWRASVDGAVVLDETTWDRWPVSGRVVVSADDAGALARLAADLDLAPESFDLTRMAGTLRLEASLGGTASGIVATGRATGRALGVASMPAVDVESTFSIDAGRERSNGTFTLRTSDLAATRWTGISDVQLGGAVTARGSWNGPLLNPVLEATVEGRNLSLVTGLETRLSITGGDAHAVLEGSLVALTGRAKVKASSVTAGERPLGAVTAELELADDTVEVRARTAERRAAIAGTVGVAEPYAFVARAEIDPTPLVELTALAGFDLDPSEATGNLGATVDARGSIADPDSLDLTIAVAPVNLGLFGVPMVAEDGLRATMQSGLVSIADVRARVGGLSLALDGTWPLHATGGRLRLALDGDVGALRPWLARADPDSAWQVSGRTDGRLEITRATSGLEATGRLTATVEEMVRAGGTIATGVTLRAALSRHRLEFEDFAGQLLGGPLRVSGGMPLHWANRWLPTPLHFVDSAEPAALDVTGTLDVATHAVRLGLAPSTSAAGAIALTAALSADGPSLQSTRGTIEAATDGVTMAGVTVTLDEPARLRLVAGRLEIESLALAAPGSRLTGAGGVDLTGDLRTNMQAEVSVDLSALAPALPGRADGSIRGEIRVTGVGTAVNVGGDLRLTDAGMLLPDQGVILDGWSGRVRIDETSVVLDELAGRINGGSLRMTGRLASQTGPDPSSGEIVASAENILLNVPEGLHSELGATLRWVTTTTGSRIGGTVSITASRYTEPVTRVMQMVRSFSESTAGGDPLPLPPWLRQSALDVAIEVTDPLVVENSLGEVELVPELRLVGTLGTPALAGRIAVLDDGQLRVGGRAYRLRDSALRFTPAAGLEPSLDLIGETRVADYDVTLRVSGTPGRLEIGYDSSPPLSEPDLRSLLVTGTIDAAARDAKAENFAITAATSDILGFAGRYLGLDSVRLGDADLDLMKDVGVARRLTVSKSFGAHYELILSDNLESGSLSWVALWKPSAGYEVRYVSFEAETQALEFRQILTFGPGSTGSSVRQAATRTTAARVSGVLFTGQPGFDRHELAAAVRLRAGDRFTVRDWIGDRERLQRFYAERGFHRARIVPRRTADEDADGGEAWQLTYDIERGPETLLESTGDPLPQGLRDELYRTWRGVPVAALLVPELERLTSEAMADRGYDRAAVHVTLEEESAHRARAVVNIDRGPITAGRRVVWSGNRALPDDELADLIDDHRRGEAGIDWRAVAWDIEQRYAALGYLDADASFEPPVFEDDVAVVYGAVVEGPRSTVAALSLEGVAEDRLAGARAAVAVNRGDPFVADTPAVAARQLRHYYTGLGFHQVMVTPRVERQDDETVAMVLVVEAGPRAIVREVRVAGVESTNDGLVREAIALQPGAVAEQAAVDITRRNLFDIGSFRRVDVRLEPDGGDPSGRTQPVALAIDAAEYKRFELRYGVLVSSDRGFAGGQQGLGLGGSVELRDRNFLGRAIQTSIGAHIEPHQQQGSALVSAPRGFGHAFRTNIFGREYRRQESIGPVTLSGIERDFSLEQRWRPRPTIEISGGYELSYRLFRLEDAENRLDFDGYLAGPTTTLSVDRRDSPFDATRGWIHSSALQLGIQQLGSNLDYVRYLGRQSHYVSAGPLTLAGSARFGLVEGYGGVAPLSVLDLLFLAGGTNTVRGYTEGSLSTLTLGEFFLGGPRMIVLNGEVRFPIYGLITGAAFVDAGNTFLSTREISWERLAVGSGFGLRVSTPLAPLRLDLAYPMSDRFGTRRLRFHFSIGQMF